jgi:hypothetical protein
MQTERSYKKETRQKENEHERCLPRKNDMQERKCVFHIPRFEHLSGKYGA